MDPADFEMAHVGGERRCAEQLSLHKMDRQNETEQMGMVSVVEIFFCGEQIQEIQVAKDRVIDAERKSGEPSLQPLKDRLKRWMERDEGERVGRDLLKLV